MKTHLLLAILIGGVTCVLEMNASAGEGNTKIPVILDTDIGDDIDDTWALGFLLRSPEFDVKLVVGDHFSPSGIYLCWDNRVLNVQAHCK